MSTARRHRSASASACASSRPRAPVFDDLAYMVIAPSVEGEVGILPRHTPFIAFLRAGRDAHQAARRHRGGLRHHRGLPLGGGGPRPDPRRAGRAPTRSTASAPRPPSSAPRRRSRTPRWTTSTRVAAEKARRAPRTASGWPTVPPAERPEVDPPRGRSAGRARDHRPRRGRRPRGRARARRSRCTTSAWPTPAARSSTPRGTAARSSASAWAPAR